MDIRRMLTELDAMFARRETDKVEGFLLEHLQRAMAEGDGGAVLTIINELVGFYRSVGMHDRSILFSRRGLALMRSMGVGGADYGTALVNAATACRAGGELNEALAYYQEAEALYRQELAADDLRMAGFYNNYGLLYRELRDYDNARACFEAALRILESHPEAHMERANSLVNLAGALLQRHADGEGDFLVEALAFSEASVREFETYIPNDHHFDTALAIHADALSQAGRVEEALPFYEKALAIRGGNPMSGGMYRQLWEKLAAAHRALGRPDAMKGISLARVDFEENGLPMLRGRFPEIADQLAAGLAGEGSECFGFDDAASIDHDFGTGFCIWTPRAIYERYGKALEAAYDALPKIVHGVKRKRTDNGRTGVIVLEDYLTRWTGSPTGEPADWLAIEEYRLATAVNGAIFFDPSGRLTAIRARLAQGYPEEPKKRVLAQALRDAGQAGQYNYARMMGRGDYVGARVALARFCEAAMRILYLREGRFAPYYKWMWRGIEANPLAEIIGEALTLPDQRGAWADWRPEARFGEINMNDRACAIMEEFAADTVAWLRAKGYSASVDSYLEHQAWHVAKGTDESRFN